MNKAKTLAIDANLLILLVVGTTARELIGKHKRLRAFSIEDFDLLVDMLSIASGIVVTPNTLTESSNLCGQIDEPARSRIYFNLQAFIAKCIEVYVASRVGSQQGEFRRLGLTDAVLLTLEDPSVTILTTDLDLYLAATRRGRNVINFNHYREAMLGY
jgi:hypothetical protein